MYAVTPIALTTAPLIRRRTEWADVSTAISRTAASGGTREARSDGKTAANIVTNVPTIMATIAVRGANTVPPAGRSIPSAIGGQSDAKSFQLALLWVLNFSDGEHSLLDIARRAKTPFALIQRAAETLCAHDLLRATALPPEGERARMELR